MAQSKEYPDLRWVEPKSWTNANRGSVQLVVIHTTEGSAHDTSAEDGAAYDARRTDGTSTHYFHDSNSTIQCVLTADMAHTARGQGNRRGIHHELCTRAGKAKWLDEYHDAMLRRAAKQVARDCRKWGIPARKLSVRQVSNGDKGICGHYDITLAFGQSTHTDPGVNFPWDRFIAMVKAELAPPPTKEEDDMATPEEIAKAVWEYDVDTAIAGRQSGMGYLVTENRRSGEMRTQIEPDQAARLTELEQASARQEEKLDQILTLLAPPTEEPVPPTL